MSQGKVWSIFRDFESGSQKGVLAIFSETKKFSLPIFFCFLCYVMEVFSAYQVIKIQVPITEKNAIFWFLSKKNFKESIFLAPRLNFFLLLNYIRVSPNQYSTGPNHLFGEIFHTKREKKYFLQVPLKKRKISKIGPGAQAKFF